jgi:hypothetical protein
MALFAVQTLCQTGGSNKTTQPSDAKPWQNMTEAERKMEAEQHLRKQKLEQERGQREFRKRVAEGKKQWRLAEEKTRKWHEELPERVAERRREFLFEKRALVASGLTEDQWKLIKPKLERVRELRDRAHSTVGLFLTSSSTSGKNPRGAQSQSVPTWRWNISWEDKPPGELTEAQKIANMLMKLVDSRNAPAKEFKQAMDTLRESRARQKELEEKLSKAREELRKGLTPRQEAALVLMRWL